jgi:hypothetical protein
MIGSNLSYAGCRLLIELTLRVVICLARVRAGFLAWAAVVAEPPSPYKDDAAAT